MATNFDIDIPKPVRKSLRKIPKPWRTRMAAVIDRLRSSPYMGDQMYGELHDKYKIRVWPYRIVYKVYKNENLIVIVEADHRGNLKSYK